MATQEVRNVQDILQQVLDKMWIHVDTTSANSVLSTENTNYDDSQCSRNLLLDITDDSLWKAGSQGIHNSHEMVNGHKQV